MPNRRVKCPTSENREERVTEDFAEVYDFFYGFQHLKRSIQAKILPGKINFRKRTAMYKSTKIKEEK